MSNIILQPCGNKLAFEHFKMTVGSPVELSKIKQYVVALDFQQFQLLYPENKCHVWGIESREGRNKKKWERIRPGDIAFFTRDRLIFTIGVVMITIQNHDLAMDLWGENGKGGTWEYLYFFSNIRPVQISVHDFNSAKGNKPGANIQGFNVLEPSISQKILDSLRINFDNL